MNDLPNLNKEEVHQAVGHLVLDNFPFVDSKVSKKVWLHSFQSALSGIENLSAEEFITAVKKSLDILEHSHTYLEELPTGPQYVPEFDSTAYIDGALYAKYSGEVVKIQSVVGREVTQNLFRTPADLERKLLRKNNGDSYKIGAETLSGEVIDLTIPALAPQDIAMEDARASFGCKTLDDKSVYIWVDSWGKQLEAYDLGEELDKYLNAERWIIDLRRNGGGDSRNNKPFISRLFEKETDVGSYTQDNKGNKVHFRIQIEEGTKKFNGAVDLLIGPDSFSSTEIFIILLTETGRARTIGEKTGGGSGNPISKSFMYEGVPWMLKVARWWIIRGDECYLEGNGIKPDFEVKKTVEDFVTGRDSVLEFAEI